MTYNDNSLENLMAEAERLGKEQKELDERNKKRKAKGRKPLLDPQEKKDRDVLNKKYRTGDSTTVDGASAMRLFELRKAEMAGGDDPDDEDEQVQEPAAPADPAPRAASEAERAVRAAEAARRVQDMKNGRIDHDGNWTDGQKLDGGDGTIVVDKAKVGQIWGVEPKGEEQKAEEQEKPKGTFPEFAGFSDFVADLYNRLRVSFDAIECTLSDLQGRVAEIVTASTPSGVPEQEKPEAESKMDEFEELLSRRTPVVFDVGGTQMTFDAITVFHAPPCITLVSRIGSAKITPKPGAQLNLTYEMDGQKYENDPVTFLGTRFDLPMFGLSFVGFIRNAEADMMDVAAGIDQGQS